MYTLSIFLKGELADTFGRKIVVLTSSVIFVIGAIMVCVAQNFDILVAGRFVLGLGVGAASMCIPLYISEIAPQEVRGSLVTCINLAITIGQFISCVVAGIFSTSPNGWRYMFGIAAIPAVAQFIGLELFIPESPRWLISRKMYRDAQIALIMLRPEGTDVHSEFKEMRETSDKGMVTQEGDGEVEKTALWASSIFLRPLLLGCTLQACQQLLGINTLMYYSATILKLAGFSNSLAIWLSALSALFNVLGTVLGFYLVDIVGRRPLTLYSLFLSVFALGLICLSFMYAQTSSVHLTHIAGYDDTCQRYNWCFDCLQVEDCAMCESVLDDGSSRFSCISHESSKYSSNLMSMDQKEIGATNHTLISPLTGLQCASVYSDSCPSASTKGAGWMLLTSLCLYLLFFSPGMGPMPWCVNSEIYPTKVRGMGVSLATSVNWLCNLIMSLTFLTTIMSIGDSATFLLYAATNAILFIFFFRFLPETKGLSLESVASLFSDAEWGRAARYEEMSADVVLVKCIGIVSVVYIASTIYFSELPT